ncbi:hypothetical protein [Halomonas sp. SL1]|nr:hypothetical protein [Halomonas sp. SL1]
MTATKAKPTDLVEVTLKKPHTHGGKPHAEGAKLRLRPDQVARLEAKGKV